MANSRSLAILAVLSLSGGALFCLGLAYGGYWAAALAIGGLKYGTVLRPQLVYGVVAAGAGAALLVTSLRLPLELPQTR